MILTGGLGTSAVLTRGFGWTPTVVVEYDPDTFVVIVAPGTWTALADGNRVSVRIEAAGWTAAAAGPTVAASVETSWRARSDLAPGVTGHLQLGTLAADLGDAEWGSSSDVEEA